MKIAVIIVRVAIALLFLVSVIGYFFNLMPQPELKENAQHFILGLVATGYMMPLVKVVELLCAVALIVNRFVPLALVVIFPITINILLFHLVLAPDSIVVPVLLFGGNIWLAWYYRKAYASLLGSLAS